MINAEEATDVTQEALRKVSANVDNALTTIELEIVKAAQMGKFEAKGLLDATVNPIGLMFMEDYLHRKGFGAIVNCSDADQLVAFKVSWGHN